MWVDWREGDDDIISMAAEALGTPALSPVFENGQLYVRYHDQLTLVPLNFEPGEQDKTLRALNQAIAADYEIRTIKASEGGDALAFMALPLGTWQALEAEFGDRVDAAFMRLI